MAAEQGPGACGHSRENREKEADAPAQASGSGRAGGWSVVFCGLGLNLALGVLYAWSVFAKQMTEPVAAGGLGLSKTEASLPYMLAIGVFALVMVPAGRLQDKVGPRLAALCGAVLTGMGLLASSFVEPGNLTPVLAGFGLLAGAGFGLGYAATTPAAIKWFPPEKKGLITGIVVSGFGLAPVYIAPLARWLLEVHGVAGAFRILGAGFTVVAVLLATRIVNPPASHSPAGSARPGPGAASQAPAGPAGQGWRDMVRTRAFWLLYAQYAFAALAGLMVIGHLARIIAVQSGGAVQAGFLFVASLAVFNALGRLMAGLLSDRLGRMATLRMVCLGQAAAMALFPTLTGMVGFFVGSAAVGFCYGACLALFPATVGDYWGARGFGLNYGLLFTAWGLGGVFGPLLAGAIADATGGYGLACRLAALLVLAAAGLSLLTRRPAPQS